MKPQFKHDCEKCVLLGRAERTFRVFPNFMPDRLEDLGSKKDIDFYFCTQGAHPTIRPTVIARYSDEGSDYASGINAASYHRDLKTAYRLAVDRGLIEP